MSESFIFSWLGIFAFNGILFLLGMKRKVILSKLLRVGDIEGVRFPLPTCLLIITALLLIAGIPLANLYAPYIDMVNAQSVWDVSPAADPHYNYRATIIILGLALTSASFVITFIHIFSRKYTQTNTSLSIATFILIFSFGIRYPYWANGLLFAKRNIISGDYDPKNLLPLGLFGDIWGAGVIVFHAMILFILPVLIFHTIQNFRKDKSLAISTFTVVLLTIASFWSAPEFITWFLD